MYKSTGKYKHCVITIAVFSNILMTFYILTIHQVAARRCGVQTVMQ